MKGWLTTWPAANKTYQAASARKRILRVVVDMVDELPTVFWFGCWS